MKYFIHLISLKKEAHLFDSSLYILKALLSVFTVYIFATNNPLVSKDMISVLFGLMMTLEPVTLTGIRSGLNQIYATTLGAISTAVLITLLGINVWTIALSVCATLFICLKINYKEVSPVAIFTTIYMTQYVQLNLAGEPSPYLTFRLRILALGTGVFIAIFYNFIFSLFSYKRMEEKRMAYIIDLITIELRQLIHGIEDGNKSLIIQVKSNLPEIFNTIDWTYSLLKDKEKEALFLIRLHLKSNIDSIRSLQDTMLHLRNITHLTYDTCYTLQYTELEDKKKVIHNLNTIINKLDNIRHYYEGTGDAFIYIQEAQENTYDADGEDKRVAYNIKELSRIINKLRI